MEPHLVGHEPMAGQPGLVQGILAPLDPLLRSTSAIVEMHYPLGASRHIGDDEAHSREQLTLVPDEAISFSKRETLHEDALINSDRPKILYNKTELRYVRLDRRGHR